jgi:hypothetical protein
MTEDFPMHAAMSRGRIRRHAVFRRLRRRPTKELQTENKNLRQCSPASHMAGYRACLR